MKEQQIFLDCFSPFPWSPPPVGAFPHLVKLQSVETAKNSREDIFLYNLGLFLQHVCTLRKVEMLLKLQEYELGKKDYDPWLVICVGYIACAIEKEES